MHSQQMFNECIAQAGSLGSAMLVNGVGDGTTTPSTDIADRRLPPTGLSEVVSTYFPAANAEQKQRDIALLLLAQFCKQDCQTGSSVARGTLDERRE